MTRMNTKVNIQPQAGASNDGNGPTHTANIAAVEWVREETAEGATALMPASSEQHDLDTETLSQPIKLEASSASDSIRLPIPNVSIRCEQCEKGLTPQQTWGRFVALIVAASNG